MEQNQSFEYTYSAQQRKEVEAIRSKYLPKAEDPMERLRALHRIPTGRAKAASITVGVLGTLILGTGMSLCMSDIGSLLGNKAMPVGIAVGLAGMVLAALAYPIYNRVLQTQRKKIAPEILRLSEELLK